MNSSTFLLTCKDQDLFKATDTISKDTNLPSESWKILTYHQNHGEKVKRGSPVALASFLKGRPVAQKGWQVRIPAASAAASPRSLERREAASSVTAGRSDCLPRGTVVVRRSTPLRQARLGLHCSYPSLVLSKSCHNAPPSRSSFFALFFLEEKSTIEITVSKMHLLELGLLYQAINCKCGQFLVTSNFYTFVGYLLLENPLNGSGSSWVGLRIAHVLLHWVSQPTVKNNAFLLRMTPTKEATCHSPNISFVRHNQHNCIFSNLMILEVSLHAVFSFERIDENTELRMLQQYISQR